MTRLSLMKGFTDFMQPWLMLFKKEDGGKELSLLSSSKSSNRITSLENIAKIQERVEAERDRHSALFGTDEGNTPWDWLSTLMEEVGEVAKAINERDVVWFSCRVGSGGCYF